jgi:hypothetical protein
MSILDGNNKNNVTLTERYCFEKLFYQCSKLTSAPSLPAINLSGNCYDWMFRGCSALTDAPELPSTQCMAAAYEYMFGYCSSLTNPPSYVVITEGTGDKAYQCTGMFYGCTKLEKSPKIVISLNTQIRNNTVLGYMFYGCRNLKHIEVSFNNWGIISRNIQSCLNWVSSVSSTGTFYCPTALGTNDTIERGTNRCPEGWTVVNID